MGDITNHSVAEVGNRSRIDAAGTISVIADITQSYNEKNIFAEVISQRTEWDWDFDAGRITSDDDLFLDALNPNLGVANSFFTSWAQSSSKGTTNNAAGSFNFFFQDNDNRAIVGEGAQINQLRDLEVSGIEDLPVTTITITDHGFYEGQRVIYAPEGETAYGLVPGEVYHVGLVSDSNELRLAASEQDRNAIGSPFRIRIIYQESINLNRSPVLLLFSQFWKLTPEILPVILECFHSITPQAAMAWELQFKALTIQTLLKARLKKMPRSEQIHSH